MVLKDRHNRVIEPKEICEACNEPAFMLFPKDTIDEQGRPTKKMICARCLTTRPADPPGERIRADPGSSQDEEKRIEKSRGMWYEGSLTG